MRLRDLAFAKLLLSNNGGDNEPIMLAPGLYQTGAIDLYYTGDLTGAEAMMTSSWDDLVSGGALIISDGALVASNSIEIAGDLVIPENAGITSIGYEAFYKSNCEGLTGIIIPEGITTLDVSAFDGCENLASLAIPSSLTIAKDWAFYNCEVKKLYLKDIAAWCAIEMQEGFYFSFDIFLNGSLLTNLVIPEIVTTLRNQIFANCISIESVVIPDSVTYIGREAFTWCLNVKNVTIPNSVTHIDEYAFSECTSLTSVTYEGTTAQWNAIKKTSGWNTNVPATYVQCSDGQVVLK